MAYVITESCVDRSDQSCVAVCPVDCIWGDLTVDRKMYVDPQGCIECGSCEAACPNGAILPEHKLTTVQADFAWVDAAWFSDPAAARSVVDELVSAA